MVTSDGLKPRAAPQSTCVPPTCVRPLPRGPLRRPRRLSDRLFRGDEFAAPNVAEGSIPQFQVRRKQSVARPDPSRTRRATASPCSADIRASADREAQRLLGACQRQFACHTPPTAPAAFAQVETMRRYQPTEHDKPWVAERSGPRLIVELDIVLASGCTGGSTSGDRYGDRSSLSLRRHRLADHRADRTARRWLSIRVSRTRSRRRHWAPSAAGPARRHAAPFAPATWPTRRRLRSPADPGRRGCALS